MGWAKLRYSRCVPETTTGLSDETSGILMGGTKNCHFFERMAMAIERTVLTIGRSETQGFAEAVTPSLSANALISGSASIW